jgi:uncharacterized MAPEG superfamily protein
MDAGRWLVLTLGMTALLWVPYVLDRFVRIGIPRTLGNPRPTDPDEMSGWARRAKLAHANAVEGLVVFGMLAALAVQRNVGATPLVVNACAAYFFARLLHYVVYTAGIPVLRTLAFLGGFGAQMALLVALWGTF